MKNKGVSIIIPCYNCEKTLKEAVDSIYKQNLENFEIILVDDKSTDSTIQIMEKLSEKYSEIKLFYNKKNMGGGATRNRAVQESKNEIIFCLDSDDMLESGTLKKMLDMILEKNCDGVGVSKSIKFKKKDINDIAYINNFDYLNKKIPIRSLFEDNTCPLYSVFMFTKKAHQKIGGYPEYHGFDTQGFAFRFLLNNLEAYTCPDTVYYHRINFHKSYYLREYFDGKININWIKILSEFLNYFEDDVIDIIINFDTNSDKNIIDEIKKSKKIFRNNVVDIKYIKNKNKLNKIESYFLLFDLIRTKTDKPNNFKINLPQYIEEIDKKIYFKKTQKINKIRSIKKYCLNNILFNVIKDRKLKPTLILNYILLKTKKILKINFVDNESNVGDQSIDIVILTVEKDFQILKHTYKSLKFINNKINKVYIVSPKSNIIEKFCKKNDCTFINEKTVLGYGKDKNKIIIKGVDRSGWIFQQLLKWSGDIFTEMDNYFIIDSDTLLINKTNVIEGNKFVLFENEEWNEPYFKSFKRLFGYKHKNNLSFTSHMMIFNRVILKEIKKEIEKKHNCRWDNAYVRCVDQSELSSISDYDNYGQYLYKNYPTKVIKKPLYNKPIDKKIFLINPDIQKKYKTKYKTLSCHDYIDK